MRRERLNPLTLQSEVHLTQIVQRRVYETCWLLLSLFQAISLVYLSGATYQDVIGYAILGPAIFLITRWFFRTRPSSFCIVPTIAYSVVQPFLVEPYVISPWISYGLILIAASLYVATLTNNYLAIVLIFFCAFLQIFGASKNLVGISDTQDTLLLNSYFSTLWIILVGCGMYWLNRVYIRNAENLDLKLDALEKSYWRRSRAISKLNLRDDNNLKLHGTVLNTLIFAQKNQETISGPILSEQLKSELDLIESTHNGSLDARQLEIHLRNAVNFGKLKVDISIGFTGTIEKTQVDIVTEFIREISLNIRKHTSSSGLNITVSMDSNQEIVLTVLEHRQFSYMRGSGDAAAASANRSLSMRRLARPVNASYETSAYDDANILHVVRVPFLDQGLNIAHEARQLREDSQQLLVRSGSLFSVIFGIFAVPGFIYLGASLFLVGVIVVIEICAAYLILRKRNSSILRWILVLLPLTIIPHIYLYPKTCSELQYVPWVLNAVLGPLLYAAYTAKNTISRWLPGIIFLGECISTNFFLPKGCQTLLNGSTPGIAIILLLARYLIKLRERNLRVDTHLESLIIEQSRVDDEIYSAITRCFDEIIQIIRNLILRLQKNEYSQNELSRTTNLIRSFLLASEYFDIDFVRELYSMIFDRYKSGLDTKLNLYLVVRSGVETSWNSTYVLRKLAGLLAKTDCTLTIEISSLISISISECQEIDSEELRRLADLSKDIQILVAP